MLEFKMISKLIQKQNTNLNQNHLMIRKMTISVNRAKLSIAAVINARLTTTVEGVCTVGHATTKITRHYQCRNLLKVLNTLGLSHVRVCRIHRNNGLGVHCRSCYS